MVEGQRELGTRRELMGIPINCESHSEILAGIARRIQERRSGGSICITNTESMYHALRRPEHMAFIKESQYSLCDGVGVIAAGYFWGVKINRYNGPILQLDCSEHGQSHDHCQHHKPVALRSWGGDGWW